MTTVGDNVFFGFVDSDFKETGRRGDVINEPLPYVAGDIFGSAGVRLEVINVNVKVSMVELIKDVTPNNLLQFSDID